MGATLAPVTLSAVDHRLLEGARYELNGYTNVAPGTDGWVLNSLVSRGLMRCVRGEIPGYPGVGSYTYIVSEEGREAYLSYAQTAVPLSDPEEPLAPD